MTQQQHVLTGRVIPPGSAAGVNAALRTTHAFRFRRHLVPFAWLASVLVTGLGAHAEHAIGADATAPLVLGALVAVTWRHALASVLTVALVTAVAVAGWHAPVPLLTVACFLAVALPWLYRHRWRPAAPQEQKQPDAISQWDRTLGSKGRLAGTFLFNPLRAGDSVQYTLQLVPGEQSTLDVFGMARNIASLFGKPMTEVYPERLASGREDQVTINLLERNTLNASRTWDGAGIDPATGAAVIGRFPDGKPVHFRFWTPRDGCEQSVVAGVKGAGKSYALYLLACVAARSEVPVITVVLDAQQGQSLTDLQGLVHYASGPPQCMRYLRAYEAGMTARSLHLARKPWTDEDGALHPGMDFFDPAISRLPVILLIVDETHLLVKHPDSKIAAEATGILSNLAKLNRKAGGHLVVAAHNLLLEEMVSSTMRSNLVSGNGICLRIGEKNTGGILGLEADPSLLPRHFADGTKTQGLGYAIGPDGRSNTPMRLDHPGNPRDAFDGGIAEFDEVFGAAWRDSLARQDAAEQQQQRAPVAAAPEPDDDAPEGRTAADAVLAVLVRRMDRGEVIKEAGALATKEWGRAKPFSVRAISDALRALTADGRVIQADRGVYDRPRASLSLVSAKGTTADTESAG